MSVGTCTICAVDPTVAVPPPDSERQRRVGGWDVVRCASGSRPALPRMPLYAALRAIYASPYPTDHIKQERSLPARCTRARVGLSQQAIAYCYVLDGDTTIWYLSFESPF